jgi:hypothetical protein
MKLPYWISRLIHKFDHVCRECGGVKVVLWKQRCAFCDKGEGKVA